MRAMRSWLIPWFTMLAASIPSPLAGQATSTAPAEDFEPEAVVAGSKPVETSGPFLIRSLETAEGEERRYALFVPPQYQRFPEKRWPVILFLHGSGECGRDGIAHTRVGLPAHIARRPNRFPFITVMPQAHRLWFRGPEAAAAWDILDEVLREYRADPDRIYLTGLSMGGFAAWEFAMWRPDVFAAVAPVCGVGNAAYAANMKEMPVWAFHGRLDDRVPVEGSREPIEALRLLGAEPKYTEFPEGNHFIWDGVYADAELYRWLLKQRRRPAPRRIEHLLVSPVTHVWWLGARAAGGAGAVPTISAEIGDDGQVRIDSSGVDGWSLTALPGVLDIGRKIRVVWNGQAMFEGEFPGMIVYPNPAASRPAAETPTASKPAGETPGPGDSPNRD